MFCATADVEQMPHKTASLDQDAIYAKVIATTYKPYIVLLLVHRHALK